MDTKRSLALISALLLSSCAVGPDYKTPDWRFPDFWNTGRKTDTLGKPTMVAPVYADIAPDWWTIFNDKTLNSLAADLEKQNPDVQTAVARLAEARAQRGIAGADLYPTVNGSAAYTRTRLSEKGASSIFSGGGASSSGGTGTGAGTGTGGGAIPTPSGIKPFNLYDYGFDASWELDLWGGVRRGVESADAQLLAAEETRRDTLLSVQAELARNYLELRGTQAQIRIAEGDIKAAGDQADIVVARAKTGLSSQQDTTSAKAQASTQRARLPQLRQQEASQISAIELLLGLAPGRLDDLLTSTVKAPPIPKRVPVTAPSELVRRRPDIRAAEARLHAATADIGVAVADFYPRITLMGNGSIQSIKASDLDSWAARTWSFGPSVSLPIFEGGRLKATLQLRKEQQKEAAIAYRKTVLQALHEVDDALTSLIAEQKRLAMLRNAESEQRLAVDLARSRYKNGLSDLLDVTVAQANLFAAEQQTAESRTALSTNIIQLYKAMGGGMPAPQAKAR